MADEKEIIETIAEILGTSVADIDPSTSLDVIEVLAMPELIDKLQQRYGIILGESELKEKETIGELAELIAEKVQFEL